MRGKGSRDKVRNKLELFFRSNLEKSCSDHP